MNLLSWLVSWLKDNGITLVALVGAAKFLFEYNRDNKRKRMEMYINLREKFRENKGFDDIFKALDKYDQAKNEATKAAARKKLSLIPYGHRYEFVALLEDIAIAMKSGALKPSVANYMFGHYAILCWDIDEFWSDLRENKEEPYWALFKHFVKRLETRRRILERFPSLVVFSMRV